MSAAGAGRVALVVGLTLTWCALWGEVSVANVLAGLVMAIGATAVGLGAGGTRIRTVRPGPLLHLLWLVMVDLVLSTISVARDIALHGKSTDEAVVAVDLPKESRDHLLLLTVAITLTPGTAVVDVDPDDGTLYLHLLHDANRDATIEHVQQLAAVACRALPIAPPPSSPESPSPSKPARPPHHSAPEATP